MTAVWKCVWALLYLAIVSNAYTVISVDQRLVGDDVTTFSDLAIAWSTLTALNSTDQFHIDIATGIYELPPASVFHLTTGSIINAANLSETVTIVVGGAEITVNSAWWEFNGISMDVQSDAAFSVSASAGGSITFTGSSVSGTSNSQVTVTGDNSTIVISDSTFTDLYLAIGGTSLSSLSFSSISLSNCTYIPDLPYNEECFAPIFFALRTSTLVMNNISYTNNHGTFLYALDFGEASLTNLTVADSTYPCALIIVRGGTVTGTEIDVIGNQVENPGDVAVIRLYMEAGGPTNSSWNNLYLKGNGAQTGLLDYVIWFREETQLPSVHTLSNVVFEDNTAFSCFRAQGVALTVDMKQFTLSENHCGNWVENGAHINVEEGMFEGNINVLGYPFWSIYGETTASFNTFTVKNHTEHRDNFLTVDFEASVTMDNCIFQDSWAYVGMFSIYGELSMSHCQIHTTTIMSGSLFRFEDPFGTPKISTLSDVHISDVTAGSGQMVYIALDQTLHVQDGSTFYRNKGSLYAEAGASLIVESTVFGDNRPVGAINANGNVDVNNCTFQNNYQSDSGGAIRFSPKDSITMLSIRKSTFELNEAGLDGGAIAVNLPSTSQFSMEDLTFRSNRAYRGGAIYQMNGLVGLDKSMLTAAAFLNNSAIWQGDDIATGLARIDISGIMNISQLSGAMLPDIDITSRDAFGQLFIARPNEPLYIGLQLSDPSMGQIVGTLSKPSLGGRAKLGSIKLYAQPAKYNITVRSMTAYYDPNVFRSSIPVLVENCTDAGMENKMIGTGIKFPSCVPITCTLGCPKANGFCQQDYCHCHPGRDGVDCSSFTGMRDSISVDLRAAELGTNSLFRRDVSASIIDGTTRDMILQKVADALLLPNKQIYFRSMVNHGDIVTFQFSVIDKSGTFVEGVALEPYTLTLSNLALPISAIDRTDSAKVYIDIREGPVILILVLAAISILMTIVTIAALLVYKTQQVVKASAPSFGILILCGCLLGYLLPFLYVGRPSHSSCVAQIWIGGLSFSIAIGNLISKNYRIFRIFNSSNHGNTRGAALPDHKILRISFAILFMELIIDAIWTAVAPLQPSLADHGTVREWTCDSTSAANVPMTIIATTYKLCLLIFACGLAYKTRNANLYSESKAITIACYALVVCAAVVLPVVLLTNTGEVLAFYLKSAGIYLSGWISTFFLFHTRLSTAVAESKPPGSSAWSNGSDERSKSWKSKVLKEKVPEVDDNKKEKKADAGYLCHVLTRGLFSDTWVPARFSVNSSGTTFFIKVSKRAKGIFGQSIPNIAIKLQYVDHYAVEDQWSVISLVSNSFSTTIKFRQESEYQLVKQVTAERIIKNSEGSFIKSGTTEKGTTLRSKKQSARSP
ncbi:uncharacterized protein SPPG_06284 [Spizellomyces punctatus DAOM BR117]|uniref:G-protein coupled receptors family 3 profile domain-containing protein n=1 Tax=Spizellomyces punctatus (strain DAOM BR117) TaxID=645134 RepID=A0A0L0HBP8_SPIPD|nr:uncharacterized protein SPPG_06284 [Spizellomyces punctatus DAOM BR117]KNC98602.1 hypothetical protein SPPG_06284 [Spizellomyces punctatus DAOM BR117]|eukprot:XP_016606642.1 hypothetical protein SPPG_06284 [Spizellomyces punctatus DAOM BR117]